jgi:hypothetical protein
MYDDRALMSVVAKREANLDSAVLTAIRSVAFAFLRMLADGQLRGILELLSLNSSPHVPNRPEYIHTCYLSSLMTPPQATVWS